MCPTSRVFREVGDGKADTLVNYRTLLHAQAQLTKRVILSGAGQAKRSPAQSKDPYTFSE